MRIHGSVCAMLAALGEYCDHIISDFTASWKLLDPLTYQQSNLSSCWFQRTPFVQYGIFKIDSLLLTWGMLIILFYSIISQSTSGLSENNESIHKYSLSFSVIKLDKTASKQSLVDYFSFCYGCAAPLLCGSVLVFLAAVSIRQHQMHMTCPTENRHT